MGVRIPDFRRYKNYCGLDKNQAKIRSENLQKLFNLILKLYSFRPPDVGVTVNNILNSSGDYKITIKQKNPVAIQTESGENIGGKKAISLKTKFENTPVTRSISELLKELSEFYLCLNCKRIYKNLSTCPECNIKTKQILKRRGQGPIYPLIVEKCNVCDEPFEENEIFTHLEKEHNWEVKKLLNGNIMATGPKQTK